MENRLLFVLFAFTLLLAGCCDDDKPCKLVRSKPPCASSPATETGEVFKFVEESPTFPGCDSIQDQTTRKKCAEEKMLAYLADNLVYPNSALFEKLEGKVYVKFVVETDGCISEIEIVKSLSCDCDSEAYRLVELMPDWNPGKQRGTPVRVQFNLPIEFEL